MDIARIRNLSIIAHIDHGKTTLTDRLMLATNTITQRQFRERLLDSNPIEQERGITIKLAPVRMHYSIDGRDYLINLIDTPGHVDFGYEVSRSLAACEGAVLLIDATQGIQAQTLSNFDKAQAQGLELVVALNKVDLPSADEQAVRKDVVESLGISEDKIISISAKTGHNIDALFNQIITRIPAPRGQKEKPLRALVFNSTFHPHLGVVAFVRVIDGVLTQRELRLIAADQTFTPKEIGIFSPQMQAIDTIAAGEVGYIATGFKQVEYVRPGDTVTSTEHMTQVTPLPGYKEPQSMVFMDIYPVEGKEFDALKEGVEKIALNDASLQYLPTFSLALGKGFRVGFLGALHAEIVLERIKREFGVEVVPTAPTVVYKVKLTSGEEIEVNNPSDLPDPSLIEQVYEPVASVTIFTPESYIGGIMQLGADSRGDLLNQTYFGSRIKLEYLVPLSEIIINFFDQLKSVSQGYASLEYELFDYQPTEVVKLSILVNKEPVEALSQIVIKENAHQLGKRMVSKLKEAIPRQLFDIPVQAAIGGTVVARETIKAYRKDVTAKLYGGDITRRMKLLEKQKKGKAKRAAYAKADIPQEAYLSVLKK